jgi:predicted DNA-binding transcriptional regulator YafY
MARARYRTPTYGAAGRLARIVLELLGRPHGWSFEAIRETLGISERTLLRYLAVCRTELVDASGAPMIEVVRHGDRRLLRLAERGRATEAGVFEAVFFYFTLTVLTFLEGTVLKEGVEGLWERLHRALPSAQRLRLANVTKKFYAVPYAAKDYRAFDERLDLLVRCLINQHRMRIDYQGLLGEGKVHEFEPYTLVMYRGGLYLLGKSLLFDKIIWLAVERMRGVEQLAERFDYPSDYSPERHTEGMFGIVEGPETTVELLLLGPETTAFLASRRLHPTQQFRRRRNGTTTLTMTVRGTVELTSWILSLSPWVRVLRPAALRDEVARRLREGVRLYAPTGAPRRPSPRRRR